MSTLYWASLNHSETLWTPTRFVKVSLVQVPRTVPLGRDKHLVVQFEYSSLMSIFPSVRLLVYDFALFKQNLLLNNHLHYTNETSRIFMLKT